MKFKVSELCSINEISLNKDHNLEYINYLDTSNLTEGKIDTIQLLYPNEEKIPSRAKRVVRHNDILYSTVRPIQKHFGFIENPIENLICSTGFVVLSPNNRVNPYYLYKYLTQEKIIAKLQSIAETSTTAYPSIKPSDIGNLELNLPNLKEQQFVSDILYSLDHKIEINNKINNNLDKLAQTLYKHWFVDFEFPNEDGLPYKSSGGKMIESELGLIPDGWKIKTIDQLTIFNKRGYSPSYTENDEPTGIPVINQRCVRNHTIIEEAVRYHNNEVKIAPQERYHKSWDVLINSMGVGTLGRVAVSSVAHDKLVHSVITILRANNEKMLNGVFSYAMLSLEDIFTGMGTGSTGQTSLSNKYLGQTRIITPPIDIQTKLNLILESIQQKIDLNYKENNYLSNLRDLLLPKLMSGEIRVPIKE